MSSKEFAKQITARARSRATLLGADGRRAATREHVGANLERRIESVRRAARGAGTTGGRSRMATEVPKT